MKGYFFVMNDYVTKMRSLIGQEMLLLVGCGAIIEDDKGQILLQRRLNNTWGIPGGLMELGETFESTAMREVEEETGLKINGTELFGIYSGKDGYYVYPDGNQIYSLQIIFKALSFEGIIKPYDAESFEHKYFSRESLPEPLTLHHQKYILDWAKKKPTPIIN